MDIKTEQQKDRMTGRDKKIFKLVEHGSMTYWYTDTKPQALEILSIIGKIYFLTAKKKLNYNFNLEHLHRIKNKQFDAQTFKL